VPVHHATIHPVVRRRRPVRAAVVVGLASLTLMSACGSDEGGAAHEMVGYRPSAEQVVSTYSLPDASQGDAPFTFEASEPDHILIAYFGYTSCPDVCPTTLSYLKKALKGIGDDADRVEMAMTTIDPNRDTDEVLPAYVQSFIPGAHALRTEDPDALRAVATAFGVNYSVETNADGEIEVAHSGNLYAVDSTGKVLLTWPFGVTADDLQGDLAALLDEIR